MQTEFSSRTTLFIFALLIIAIVAGGILVMAARPEPVEIVINPPVPTVTPAPTNTPEPILVYVTGAVHNPQQTILLPHGSRVSDALEQAGGTTADADLEQVNLAAILHDGDQIHVPVIGESNIATTMRPTPSGGTRVYINTATLDELQTLPGVGPALAQRIIDDREANGAFTSLADLDRVSGIGASTLETLETLISFE